MIKLTSLGSKVLIENGVENPYTVDVVDMDFIITDSTHVSFDRLGGVPILISEFEIEGDVPADIAAFKTAIATVFPDAGGAATPTFLEYTALLTQEGVNAPVATVLENTIGAIVWTRTNVGEYVGTLAGAFTDNKTALHFSSTVGFFGVQWLSVNGITVNSRNLSGEETDEMLFKNTIEIKVYP